MSKRTSRQQCFSEVHTFKVGERTAGDGMEIDASSLSSKTSKDVDVISQYRSNDKSKSLENFNIDARKEPDIVEERATLRMTSDATPANSVFSICPPSPVYISRKENNGDGTKEFGDSIEALRQEIRDLKNENHNLEGKVNFQLQVNDEIKKLLIAAVGEDVETKVHLLAEDKFNLAKELINTAKSLSTHHEQIEWLAGQCEVWRSKFLASSMLVEDLNRVKDELCSFIYEHKNAIQLLLRDNRNACSDAVETFLNLTALRKILISTDTDNGPSKSQQSMSLNLLNANSFNRQLSEMMVNQLLSNEPARNSNLNYCTSSMPSEVLADEIVSKSITTSENTELAYNAVITGAAMALSAASPHCSHCTGAISTI